jgi:two-component system heavy metal sensor histidine kinase CusS
MTVHGRMTLGLSLLTLLTLGVAFAAISVVLDRYQERELDDALLQVARVEAQEAPTNHFSFTSRPGPAANDVGPLDKYGIIFDERGAVLNATQPFDKGKPRLADMSLAVSTPFDFSFAGRRYRGVVVPIPGYPRHRLLLAASRDDLDGDSRFVRRAMAIALLVSVAWLLGAIGWLVRRNLREHQRIADILHRIATGDVKARVTGEVSDRDLRRVGSDVDEIAQQLARLVGHQRRFIAHAAHELRSPLTALHGEIQQALRKERTGEEYRKSLEFLLKASGRLKHLTDELLELARAEQPAKASEPVSLDLALVDVVESLQPLASEKNVTIACDSTDVTVLAVTSDVERIFRNLLDNAIRHSPAGGVVRLDVEAGETVRVCVRDQGDGVSLEERENIFEPFYRSPVNRTEARGAGLGLAIARELAQKHGGDVVVGDEGNCFIASFPRYRHNEPELGEH